MIALVVKVRVVSDQIETKSAQLSAGNIQLKCYIRTVKLQANGTAALIGVHIIMFVMLYSCCIHHSRGREAGFCDQGLTTSG